MATTMISCSTIASTAAFPLRPYGPPPPHDGGGRKELVVRAVVSRWAQPAQGGRRVLGVVGRQAAVVGFVHHQQLEPARAVLHVHLDAELVTRAAFLELALKLAAQA